MKKKRERERERHTPRFNFRLSLSDDTANMKFTNYNQFIRTMLVLVFFSWQSPGAL